MRIVYFIDHLRPEGTQSVLKKLIHGLGQKGYEQTIFCLNNSWDELLVRELRNDGAEIHIVGKLALVSAVGLFSIWMKLRQKKYDIAVTFLFVSTVIGSPLARFAGVQKIFTPIRNRNVYFKPWQRLLIRQMKRFSDLVIINSNHLRDFAISEEGAIPNRICVIYNGIDVNKYRVPNTRAKLNVEFGIPPNSFLIGSVGRLTHQKGFDILLRSIANLERSDLFLLLIGNGEEYSNLQKLASTLGLGDCVQLTGYRRDIPYLLSGLDLYVQPSRYEGMPNALLEAMASRCPIVATAVDGILDLIVDGKQGWLVNPDDPIALSNVIRFAISKPDDSIRCGLAAQRHVMNSFSEKMMVDRWEEVFVNYRKQ